ncbi:MAG: TIGR03619 family F420-dependent LLM class oxidoreductase [Deltaproteobacteria bacterium]|nr:TIGR03619 family F420-dependent LLM class oxidoreductase [Deltaproteobacteria bacterium]
MELGVTIFATDRSIAPAELAREAEARGFASLFVPEHTHIPVSRETPPPTGERELADEYRRTLDPWVGLATAAAVTSRIRLGSGIALVAQRDPIALAKTIATLDHLSGGRVVVGVGFGWNREEMRDHGVAFERRREHVREVMLAMQALWSEDVAGFAGEHLRFAPSWQWPKPVQQPRPRILLGGGAGPKLFAHLAEWADGWMPIGGAGLREALPALRRALTARGRDPSALHVVPMGVLPERAKLDYYASLGVTEAVLRLPSAPREQVLPVLDHYARFL